MLCGNCRAWFYWADPLAYAQKALAVNEFDAPRWQEIFSGGLTVGDAILMQRNLPEAGFNRWLGLGAVVSAPPLEVVCHCWMRPMQGGVCAPGRREEIC